MLTRVPHGHTVHTHVCAYTGMQLHTHTSPPLTPQDASQHVMQLEPSERAQLLGHLKRKWASLNEAYQKLPLSTDSELKKHRKVCRQWAHVHLGVWGCCACRMRGAKCILMGRASCSSTRHAYWGCDIACNSLRLHVVVLVCVCVCVCGCVRLGAGDEAC